MHYQAGCRFNFLVRELYVWCFLDKYPARIEVDCRYLTPKFSVKIGDVEKMLPHGMYSFIYQLIFHIHIIGICISNMTTGNSKV